MVWVMVEETSRITVPHAPTETVPLIVSCTADTASDHCRIVSALRLVKNPTSKLPGAAAGTGKKAMEASLKFAD
jgi:hypothetical protein